MNTISIFRSRAVFPPKVILQAESLALLVVNALVYGYQFPHSWGWFALWFLAPDLSMIPYAWKAKGVAADVYNLCHNYLVPVTLGLVSWRVHWMAAEQFSIIWTAHISLDRFIGFGLKYPQSFKFTHIQRSAAIGG